jgi:hypothetical protein
VHDHDRHFTSIFESVELREDEPHRQEAPRGLLDHVLHGRERRLEHEALRFGVAARELDGDRAAQRMPDDEPRAARRDLREIVPRRFRIFV